MRICLVGPRGAGKSRAARRLSVLLRRPVISTDVLVSYECGGRPVADIIRQKGGGVAAWRFFRQKEFEILKKISALENVIVDCGGGVVVDLDRRGAERYSARKARLLRTGAVVVFLRADPARLESRVAADSCRPALGDGQTERDIMRRRAPFYVRVAHVAVDTDELGAKNLAHRILHKIEDRLKD